jgi:hypothetical protein
METTADQRTWLVRYLGSGSPDAEIHPVRLHERNIAGRLPISRSFKATDLVDSAGNARDLAQFQAAASLPSWGLAFAAFTLHGFCVDAAEAEGALHKLRRANATDSTAALIVATHDQLQRDFASMLAAEPRDILHAAARWPCRLTPRATFFALLAFEALRAQYRALSEELDSGRHQFAKAFTESSKSHKAERSKEIKRTVTKRFELYLAALSWCHFNEGAPRLAGAAHGAAPIGAKMAATELNKLIGPLSGNPRIDANTELLWSDDRLARILATAWNEMGLPKADGTCEPDATSNNAGI